MCVIEQDEGVTQTAQLIYQTALMESGFSPADPKDFASRIYGSVKNSLNISPDAAVEEEEEDVEEPEATESPKTEDVAEDDLKDEL